MNWSSVLRVLRDYWSVVPLVAFAAVLLVLGGGKQDDTLAAVGWGFAGGAIVRWVDIGQERKRARVTAEDERRRDLDETRRLLYAEYFRPTHNEPLLVATLVNALGHHSLRADPKETAMMLRTDADTRGAWIMEQIGRINASLDDPSKTSS